MKNLVASIVVLVLVAGCGPSSQECSSDAFCAAGLVCAAGVCIEPEQRQLCTASLLFCEGNVAKECGENGRVVRRQDCGESAVCLAGVCDSNQICEANESVCQDNTVLTCDDQGVGWRSHLDCGEAECHRGACLDLQTCTAATTFCRGNTVFTCDGSGGASADEDCGSALCVDGQCQPMVCQPGVAECSGDIARTCHALGTHYIGVRTCGGDQVCLAGRCQQLVCSPGGSCVGQQAVICNTQGTQILAEETCTAGCRDGRCISGDGGIPGDATAAADSAVSDVTQWDAGVADAAISDVATSDAAASDAAVDLCALNNWYGDRVCDSFCPLPDPDCSDSCVTFGLYSDRYCDTNCDLEDPDCTDTCVTLGHYGDRFCDTTCVLSDPDCEDPCVTGNSYNDGTCDSNCSQADPDCSQTCPANAHLGSDGNCYCDSGYEPDLMGVSCVPVGTCPAHSHSQGDSCVCDSGYQPNAQGTACVAEGSTPNQTLGAQRTIYQIDFPDEQGSVAGIAAMDDQVFVMKRDGILRVYRVDAPSQVKWDLSGGIGVDPGGMDVFAGYVYVADEANGSPHDGSIKRIPVEPPQGDPAVVTLKYSLTGPRHPRIHNGWVYYTQAGFSTVWRTRASYASPDHEYAGTTTDDHGPVKRFQVSGQQIMTLTSDTLSLGTIGDPDSFVTVVQLSSSREFAWDGDQVFLSTVTVYRGGDVRGQLLRYTLSSDQSEVVAGNLDDVGPVRLFGDHVYFGSDDGVHRVLRNGGPVEVVSGSCAPSDLEVTAAGVFFACLRSVFWVPFL